MAISIPKWLKFTWLNDNLVDVVKWRYVLLSMSIIEALLFGGLVFGWANLVVVLKAEQFFQDLCPNYNVSENIEINIHNEDNFTCIRQDELLQAVFTVATFVPNAVLVLIGVSIDRFGPRIMRLLASAILIISFLMFALATKESPMLLFPALSLCSTGGTYFLLTLFQVGNLFDTKRSTVISILNGSFDASAAVFLIFQYVYDVGVSMRALFIAWSLLALITIIDTLILIPTKPILPPGTEMSSLSAGTLGNYFHVFRALEVVNVSLLGMHSTTIPYMKKPSLTHNHRSRRSIVESVSVSYQLNELSDDDKRHSIGSHEHNNFLNVSGSDSTLHAFYPHNEEDSTVATYYPQTEDEEDNQDEVDINFSTLQSVSYEEEEEAEVSLDVTSAVKLPVISVQHADELNSKIEYNLEHQNHLSMLDNHRSNVDNHTGNPYLASMNLDTEYTRVINNSTEGTSYTVNVEINNECEIDSLATDSRRVSGAMVFGDHCYDIEIEDNDAVSIHSLAIDPFEPQSQSNCNAKDVTTECKSLPPSPAGSIASAVSSVYNLSDLFFEDNFVAYSTSNATTDIPEAPIQSLARRVSVTITDCAENYEVYVGDDEDNDGDDSESVSSIVLAAQLIIEQNNSTDNTVISNANKEGHWSCTQSPTGSTGSAVSNLSSYHLNLLFSDCFADRNIAKIKEDLLAQESTQSDSSLPPHYGLDERGKKTRSRPSSPVGSIASAASVTSSTSGFHLRILFEDNKANEQNVTISNVKDLADGMEKESVINEQQSNPCNQSTFTHSVAITSVVDVTDAAQNDDNLSRQQSDQSDKGSFNVNDSETVLGYPESKEMNDQNYEALYSNNSYPLPVVSEVNESEFTDKYNFEYEEEDRVHDMYVRDGSYNYFHRAYGSDRRKSNSVGAGDLSKIPNCPTPKTRQSFSPSSSRRSSICVIPEDGLIHIPAITITRTNSEEESKQPDSNEDSDCVSDEIGFIPRSSTLAQLLRQDSRDSRRRYSYVPIRRDSSFTSHDDIELPQLRLHRCMTDSRANYNIYTLSNAFALPTTHTARLKTISEAGRKRVLRSRLKDILSDSNKNGGDSTNGSKQNLSSTHNKKSTLKRIRSDSSLSIKSEYMLNWKAAIKSPLFICHCLYLGFIQLRLVFFIGSLHSFLNDLANNDAKIVTEYTNAFGWVQMFGIVASVAIGILMDYKISESEAVEIVQMTTSAIAYAVINVMTVLFGVVTAIPVLSLQYVSFFLHTLIRAFIYSANSSFIAIAFPIEYHSTLIAVSLLASAIISIVQFPLFVLISGSLNGDPLWVNIVLLIISIISFGYPLLIWHESKKLEEEAVKMMEIQNSPTQSDFA